MASLRSFALSSVHYKPPSSPLILSRLSLESTPSHLGGISVRDVESYVGWVRYAHKRSLGSRGLKGVEKIFQSKAFKAYAGEFEEETLEPSRSNLEASSPSPQPTLLCLTSSWLTSPCVRFSRSKKTRSGPFSTRPPPTRRTGAPWLPRKTRFGAWPRSRCTNGSSQYIYDESAGAGTYSYVIGSDVRISHDEFDGRASMGYIALPGVDIADNVRHGTHVAGTVAGATVGIAKRANPIGIKIFEPSVSTSMADVLDAFNWAVDDIVSNDRQSKAVIVMPLDDAFEAGVLSVVSAGNTNEEAGLHSPASAADAMTVGATDAA
ncbi:hypothetical protein DL771_006985 [Monosporascus sp. 5C6A]|nr:hypothetical protein DL771_006985 [Monosporascus sp. 5C6A]